MEGEKGGDACAGGRVQLAVAAGEARAPPTTRGSVVGLGRTEGGGSAAATGERGGRGKESPRAGKKKIEEHNSNNGGGSPEKTKFTGAEKKYVD